MTGLKQRHAAWITRRGVMQGLAAVGAVAALDAPKSLGSSMKADYGSPQDDLSKEVDIFLGTGGHGHCYPGAAVPFGAVQLSPDTYNGGWDSCSGYHISDNSVMGFSHTHLSGTGVGNLLTFWSCPVRALRRLSPEPASIRSQDIAPASTTQTKSLRRAITPFCSRITTSAPNLPRPSALVSIATRFLPLMKRT